MAIAQRLSPETAERFRRRLAPQFQGTIRTDRLIRAIYATDASIYELAPDVVLFPESAADIQHAVRQCGEMGIAITPRGAGTGLTGAAVNHGVQLDCSRHLNRILDIDPEKRIAIVEAGVVLDHLNAALAPHGLQFAPDVATSSRATIGGMIANNSCGAHSVLYGRTCDHVVGLDVVLADGSIAHFSAEADNTIDDNPLARRCNTMLRDMLSSHAEDIAERYPKVLRSNAGYALDRLTRATGRLPPSAPLNTPAFFCGSEGTLGIVTRAVLNLVPLPKAKGLVVVQFAKLLDALSAVPAALGHNPAAVELIDALILSAARKNPKLAAGSRAITGHPEGVLVIELYEDDATHLAERLQTVRRDMQLQRLGDGHHIVIDASEQTAVWDMRKAGLGLLMSKPGDHQPYAFVEDSAVDPSRLRDYIARFAEILAEENVAQAGYYAHASVGCLHVRPVLNLKERDDVARMRRIAERVSALAFKFGGTMTGEHGDGLLRSEWIEQLYGPRLVEAFRTIKRTFDPRNILNPGKIVDPPRMTEHLRYGESFRGNRDAALQSTLDFSSHGGMLNLAGMCSGVGQCRQKHVGTMCPSYEGTGDEMHTTRARANALRLAMSNRSLLDGLDDPALDEVMDLCISCKACKSECPTGVDMARLKAEWQHRRHQSAGAPLRTRLVAHTAHLARIAGKVPTLANAVAQSRLARRLADRFLGIDQRIPPPMLARQSFRAWFDSRRLSACATGYLSPSAPSLSQTVGWAMPTTAAPIKPHTHEGSPPADAPLHALGRLSHPDSEAASIKTESPKRILYFVDTWTDLFTPNVGKATVRVLEAFGYEVIVPPPLCCGRPALSKGMLDVARDQLTHAVDTMIPLLDSVDAIVGTEPSCVFTLIDELPQLVRTDHARKIAANSQMIETFLTKSRATNSRATALGATDLGATDPGTTALGATALKQWPSAAPALKDRHVPDEHPVGRTIARDTPTRSASVLLHGHCHQKALLGTADTMALLKLFDIDAQEINSGCCGMAGAFGHEREHADVSRAIGESRLFPAIRDNPTATIAVSGFSCRHQIGHYTDAVPRHVMEIIAGCLDERIQ